MILSFVLNFNWEVNWVVRYLKTDYLALSSFSFEIQKLENWPIKFPYYFYKHKIFLLFKNLSNPLFNFYSLKHYDTFNERSCSTFETLNFTTHISGAKASKLFLLSTVIHISTMCSSISCIYCALIFQCLPILNFSTTTSLNAPKFCASPVEAVEEIPDGSKLLVGGE